MGIISHIRQMLSRTGWDRFTDRSRAVMALANLKALQENSPNITPEHLLAAIVEEGHGVGTTLLRYVGVHLGALQPQAIILNPSYKSDSAETTKMPLAPSVKTLVDSAIDEAIALADNYVGTEHLVLALSRSHVDALAHELEACALTTDGLRNALRALRSMGTAAKFFSDGKWNQAISEYRRVLKFKTDERTAANNLAWLLATCPDAHSRSGDEALKLMDWAISGTINLAWWNCGTIAAAYAETGQFEEATKWGTKAMEMATGVHKERWEKRLLDFRQFRPVREPGASNKNP